ncbi:MAG: glucose-1-phosphate adenylyltransferase [Gammaproteobacteria bacterium]|nr:glucose-1-phosphate adenylyltransferase [Gammaproteobacteria bacterium]
MDKADHRRVSRLTRSTLALILAGGQGSRLHELTTWRAKPAVPFGGKFRIIDFPLSNCINSGIRQLGVLTQYKSHSLIRHLVNGWSGMRSEFGESMEILPASMRVDEGWYKGTADAIFQNLDIIRTQKPTHVLILGGDHIYKMDYGPLIAQHADWQADMTVSCVEVSVEEAAGSFGVIQVDSEGRVIGFEEKPAKPAEIPGKPGRVLASMGNYVFNTGFLYEQLIRDADTRGSSHDFGKDILPYLVPKYRVYAYRLGDDTPKRSPYWRDVGTIDALWDANMELVGFEPELDLYDQEWPICTLQPQLPPAKFIHATGKRRGLAVNCIVSGGCIVSGAQLRGCLLFSNVHAHSYSKIKDSVIMPDVVIHRNCVIDRAIIDRGCVIDEGTEIGVDHEADRERGFRVTEAGITLVTPDMLQQDLHQFR